MCFGAHSPYHTYPLGWYRYRPAPCRVPRTGRTASTNISVYVAANTETKPVAQTVVFPCANRVLPLLSIRRREMEEKQEEEPQPEALQVLSGAKPAEDASEPYTVFTKRQRQAIVLLAALAGFFSPFSAFVYFPALDALSADLRVPLQLLNVTITLYLIAQGVVPAFLGGLADQVGRRPVYLAVLLLYLASGVGLAVQRSYAALLVLRMLQSAGSSGTIALGTMVVADIAPPHQRGAYVGAMLTGPNTGPSLGPVVGGLLADRVGWPWIFWLLAIVGGICLFCFVLWFPETCRHVVGNGSIRAVGVNRPVLSINAPQAAKRKNNSASPKLRTIPNPLRCLRLIFRKEDALVLASNATFYTNYSCIQASLANLVMQKYQLNGFEAGLCYLAYGIATLASSFAVGKVIDYDYRATAKALGITINKSSGDDMSTFPLEKARIRSIWYFIAASIASTLVYGWTVSAGVHLSVPLIMQFLCGLSTTGVFNICLTLYMDLHPKEPGVASVAVSLTRCLAAAAGVAILQVLLDAVGAGWTFTVYSLICGLSVPMLLTVRISGQKWRKGGA
ncbi:putative major facilitator superfamily transporter [Xylariomycetidae sp. FL0641]|nr:putative major facilitator superfamily transporter [Xylariomycetidae sp. FL0641]